MKLNQIIDHLVDNAAELLFFFLNSCLYNVESVFQQPSRALEEQCS